jgi:DNA repair protein RadC
MSAFQLRDLLQPSHACPDIYSPVELSILRRASELLARSLKRQTFNGPDLVSDYLRCKLAGMEFEVFGAIYLDSQLQFIADDVLFRGTITSTTVHPREVVRQAFRHNASHLILYHNHPSLSSEPSRADESLTARLKSALELIDVKIQDHFVIAAGGSITSFAERGLI